MTAAQALKSLIENKMFLSTFTALVAAQILKMIFYLITSKKRKKWDAIETMIWRTG